MHIFYANIYFLIFILYRFLLTLVDFVLSPDTPTSTPVTHLPSLTPSLLLQPFLPVVPFPTYFEPLYKFIHNLEQLLRDTMLGQATFDLERPQQVILSTSNYEQLETLVEFISADLSTLLDLVSDEGFPLLLLHLFPLFTNSETSFDVIFSLLDPLSQRMGRRNVERLFSLPLIHLFDSATPPHQRARLLCRTTTHMIIRRFGLRVFIGRFLGFYLEAILEPLRVTNTKPIKRVNTKIMRMSSQNMLNMDALQSQPFEGGRSRNAEMSFSYALSDNRHGYDMEKEDYYSSDESDVDLGPEASILAKTTMYTSPTSVTNEPDFSPATPPSIITENSLTSVSPHTETPLTSSPSVEDMTSDLPDSPRPMSPAYDTNLTASMIGDAVDGFEGYRGRSDSLGGRSLVGDTKEEVVQSESDDEEELGTYTVLIIHLTNTYLHIELA